MFKSMFSGPSRLWKKTKEGERDATEQADLETNEKAMPNAAKKGKETDKPKRNRENLAEKAQKETKRENPAESTDHDQNIEGAVEEPEEERANRKRQKLLQGQLDRETNASEQGLFVENQRVQYHLRANDTFYEATIVGVHFDDGPDKPYYTIKYNRTYEDGTSEVVEKQTTPDRLERVEWDEEKTWTILGK